MQCVTVGVRPPKSVMRACRKLWLGDNKLTAVPDGIMQLRNLRHLYLEDNLLESLPASLAQMPHIERIYVDRNPLGQVHDQLRPLLTAPSSVAASTQQAVLPQSTF